MRDIFLLGVVLFAACAQAAPQRCAVTNCHGLEIRCGENPPDFCTKIYAMGDLCRSLASCEVVDGECHPVLSKEFQQCADCVRLCQQHHQSGTDAFACESKCRPHGKSVEGQGRKLN